MRIALIGREAEDYANDFPEHDCRVIDTPMDITPGDDLVFCLSLAQLIPAPVLSLPKYGCWVNHSTDLPQGRGWAPLQWSVLNGLSHVTVTLFKATPGMDDGPWAFKERFPIGKTDTIAELYRKDRETSLIAYRKLIDAIAAGKLELHEQTGTATYWRKRTPEDGRLDPSLTLAELWDHIRIADPVRYPAYFLMGDRKVFLRPEVEGAESTRPPLAIDIRCAKANALLDSGADLFDCFEAWREPSSSFATPDELRGITKGTSIVSKCQTVYGERETSISALSFEREGLLCTDLMHPYPDNRFHLNAQNIAIRLPPKTQKSPPPG